MSQDARRARALRARRRLALEPKPLSFSPERYEATQAKLAKDFAKFDSLPQVVRNAFNSERRTSKGGVGTARDRIVFQGEKPESVARSIRGSAE